MTEYQAIALTYAALNSKGKIRETTEDGFCLTFKIKSRKISGLIVFSIKNGTNIPRLVLQFTVDGISYEQIFSLPSDHKEYSDLLSAFSDTANTAKTLAEHKLFNSFDLFQDKAFE